MNTSPVDPIPRDVRLTPQSGDIVSKANAKGRIRRRTVIDFKDNYVHYFDSKKPLPCMCWITAWQEWCRGATVEKAV